MVVAEHVVGTNLDLARRLGLFDGYDAADLGQNGRLLWHPGFEQFLDSRAILG